MLIQSVFLFFGCVTVFIFGFSNFIVGQSPLQPVLQHFHHSKIFPENFMCSQSIPISSEERSRNQQYCILKLPLEQHYGTDMGSFYFCFKLAWNIGSSNGSTCSMYRYPIPQAPISQKTNLVQFFFLACLLCEHYSENAQLLYIF